MHTLVFDGTVRSNTEKFHQQMVVPGRDSLPSAPHDWPVQLVPGTLNIQIDLDCCNGLAEIGSGVGVKKFDEGIFIPALVIAQHQIVGNTLKPKDGQSKRGTGQVWRAELSVNATGATAKCWMLRRIGSAIESQIELVSDSHLRTTLNLENNTEVTLKVFES